MPFSPKKIKTSTFWKNPNLKKKKGVSKFLVKPLLKNLFLFFFFVFLIGGLLLVWIGLLLNQSLPDPNHLIERKIPESTKIYDRTGSVLLYEIHGEEKRTLVNLDEISDYVKWATIVAEDKDFYRHKGFSLKGIARALLVDLLQGKMAQGGSTITQQLVKNAILTSEKTYTRKLKELLLAYRIEKKFSKDEILKMYFNEIPYGSNLYGVEAASFAFFGKKAKDLDLVESALIAALPKAPSYYSPFGSHPDALEKRVFYIIDGMVEEGYISREEAEKAKQENIFKKLKSPELNIKAPHFSLYIKNLLLEKYGKELAENGGLKVITTLDWSIQQMAEETIKKEIENIEKKYGGTNAAAVVLDPKTGQVLAMVGSRDYFDTQHDGAVNVALRPRQPGSSFKPIVYATAFARGFTPETILYDVETTFKNYPQDYTPHNYDGKEHGPITMKKALGGSLNIPAVKTLYLAGLDNVLNVAKEMGYTTFQNRSQIGLSLVLGGSEVKLLEHVAAYAVFANNGFYLPPSFILRVEDSRGKILENWQQPNPKKIFDKNVAAMINDILSDNKNRAFIFGEKNALVIPGHSVAAKTGTTNDWRDGWTLGYTPSVVLGVWVGNNSGQPMKRGADGVLTAGPIWNKIMTQLLKNRPNEEFIKPTPEKVEKPILRGEDPGLKKVIIDKASNLLATDLTPPEMREEKTFYHPHSILFYLDKNNPRGDPPSDPSSDPQFQNWEEGIINWAKKQGLEFTDPPTSYDNIHTPENQPIVEILEPQANQNLSNKNLKIKTKVFSKFPLKKISVFINDEFLGNLDLLTQEGIFSLDTSLSIANIKVEAYDEFLNKGLAEVYINFNL